MRTLGRRRGWLFGWIVPVWVLAVTLSLAIGGGRFSPEEEKAREILEITNFDKLWPMCSSREEALASVKS